MKLKTVTIDGKTYAEVSDDGKPIYTGDDNKEIAFDAASTVGTINRLTDESKGFKQRAQTAEAAVATFAGISDPAAALKALETVKNLDDKKLVEAGQVETIKAEAIKAVEEKYKPVVEERDALKGQYNGLIKGQAFANSKFVSDKVAVPRHMLERTYGDNFRIEDGKLVPHDAAGNKLFSRAKPGEVADFDEAIELLISADPFKDHILKGSTGAGGGAGQGGGGQGGAKTIPRDQWDAMPQADRMAKSKDGFKVID